MDYEAWLRDNPRKNVKRKGSIHNFEASYIHSYGKPFVDDYGDIVFKKCPRTGHGPFWVSEGRLIPPEIPTVKGMTFVHNSYTKEMQKYDKALFDDLDANCNTCKYLIRMPNNKFGEMQGKCASVPDDGGNGWFRLMPIPDDGVFSFHPTDFMGLKCYSNRYYDKDTSHARTESSSATTANSSATTANH